MLCNQVEVGQVERLWGRVGGHECAQVCPRLWLLSSQPSNLLGTLGWSPTVFRAASLFPSLSNSRNARLLLGTVFWDGVAAEVTVQNCQLKIHSCRLCKRSPKLWTGVCRVPRRCWWERTHGNRNFHAFFWCKKWCNILILFFKPVWSNL